MDVLLKSRKGMSCGKGGCEKMKINFNRVLTIGIWFIPLYNWRFLLEQAILPRRRRVKYYFGIIQMK
jgi:hypothetical protein